MRNLLDAAGPRRARDRVRDRAEGGRARDLAGLRGRGARARRHARRRRDRRGRDPEPADDRRRSRCRCRRTAKRPPALVEVRGEVYLPLRRLRPPERAAGRRRARARSRIRATRPPARSASSIPKLAASRPLSIWCYGIGASRGSRPPDPLRVDRVAAQPRLQGQPRRRAASRTSTPCSGACRALGGAARAPRLRDRRRRREDQRLRDPARAGRRRARAALGDRLQVLAHDRGHEAGEDRGERRPHRQHGPVRDARAGRRSAA